MKPLLLRNQGTIGRTRQRQTAKSITRRQTARQPKFKPPEGFNAKSVYFMRYATGGIEPAAKYGGQFIDSFKQIALSGKKRRGYIVNSHHSEYESAYSVALSLSAPAALRAKLCGAGIGFGEKVVVIESLHGSREKVQPELERFRETYGKPGANYLIHTVEEHARKNGFEWAIIRHPKSLYYYQHPTVRTRREAREVRKRMLALYQNAAYAMGYERQGSFFVKKLN
ncbi:MAG: hypothetical protein WC634_00595 [archaeon]